MIKARNRKLSMLLVLAMLMTMFVGVGAASAADMYSVGSVPAVESGENGQKLGSIIVTAYNFEKTSASLAVNPAVYGDAGFIVKLPADFKIEKVAGQTFNPLGTAGVDANALVNFDPFNEKGLSKAKIFIASTKQENRIKVMVVSTETIEELKFTIPLEVETPSTLPDEVKAMIAKEPGSVFNDNLGITVATSASSSVQAIANDTITITAKDNDVTFSVRSNTADALDKLSVKLPAGFTWNSADMKKGNDKQDTKDITVDQGRTAKFTFKGDRKGIWTFEGQFNVDESRAKFGDVVLTLSGSGVSPSSITIGTYADFGIELEASDAPTVVAGRTEVEVADIKIKETAAASLVNGRSVYLTLPDGARWLNETETIGGKIEDKQELVLDDVDKTGSLQFDKADITVNLSKKNVAKFVVNNKADANGLYKKGSLTIEAPQVELAPDFKGELVVEVSGSAGVEGKIKVAEVVAPVDVKADVVDVKIGLQAQAGGNIVITETEAEALEATIDGANGYLELKAPLSVQWAKIPTVKVTDGDLEIGSVTRDLDNRLLKIRIKETSTTASKIEISDVAWTVDRTVPEGDMKVSVAGNAVVQVKDFDNRTSVTSFVAAKVVTPAPGETATSGEFRIGSNIYYVGGAAKVMDAAPYIKGDRTYVPMRYAAEIIGAEVVWDDAARTVTLTKGDDVAVFTIGSTTYTVNGEAMTADVAPEIFNSRTMLPARFVAEAFGAVVGWDAGTQTVLIQK